MKRPSSPLKPLFYTLLSAAILGSVVYLYYGGGSDASTADYKGAVIFVSATGSDTAPGSQEAPLATIRKALELLPNSEGGTIVLKKGVYSEPVTIDGTGGAVRITAAPGDEVVFEGGQAISNFRPHPEHPGVFLAEVPHRESLYGHIYFDLWGDSDRVRYGKVADAEAVRAWPGSVMMLEGDTILFHPHSGAPPEALNLWANRRARGFQIKRNNTTIEGIRFKNFLGGTEARAITIVGCRDILIRDCQFQNCTLGVATIAEAVTIEKCQFREVGNGIRQAGKGRALTVRESIFESAIGKFAFSDVSEHLRNGIRIYFYSDGITVEQCVTTGFWAGLYIKTISGKDGSLPYTIRNNTFLDGLRSGADCPHPRTTISQNIIGTPSTPEGAGVKASYYEQMGAKLNNNLFIGSDAPENRDPFLDLAKGDLRFKKGISTAAGATSIPDAAWNARTAQSLSSSAPQEVAFGIATSPAVSASRHGATLSASFTRPAHARLRYREKGSSQWKMAKGRDTTIYPATSMIAATPFEPKAPSTFPWVFPLAGKDLAPARTYEYELSATALSGGSTPVQRGTFATLGEAREIHVSPRAGGHDSDGSKERPFATLQAALDRVIAGDTVTLAPGIYTAPASLSHGGTEQQRITIRGSGWEKTILDGGKQAGTILELNQAPNVTVRDLQVRWFGNYGLRIRNSPHFRLERSWIWNQDFSGTGVCGIGLQLNNCEGSTVTGCVFNRTQSAVIASQSPRLTFTHNTAFANVYSGLDLVESARDSVVAYNSLTFTGNRSLFIRESDENAFQTLHCDFNNYASKVRSIAPKRPENDFTPAARYGPLTGQSKGIIAITMGEDVWRDFHTMKEWREFSQKDQHSIFIDPEYVDPLQKDLRLLPDSPNRLPDGRLMGAFPVASSAAGTR